jgi:putative membrane protein
MKIPNPVVAVLLPLFAVIWLGGVSSYLVLGRPPTHTEWAPPLFLALSGSLALAASGPRDRWILAGCGVLGWLSEVLGVHTGFPFGSYRYTEVLDPRLAEVPLVLGFAWITLIAFVRQLTRSWPGGWGPRAVGGAVLMVVLDLIIDPLAAGALGYWRWNVGGAYYGIPGANFAGWFMVSLVLLAAAGRRPAPSRITEATGLSVVVFFTIIAWDQSTILPAAIGSAWIAAHAGWRGRRRLTRPR